MAIRWKVTDKGYIFSQKNVVDELWSILADELDVMAAEDRAVLVAPEVYLLSHDVAASLDYEERDLLLLPRNFPYNFRITTTGNVVDKNFNYNLELLKPNGEPFINPQIVGSYVKINDELEYLLNTQQLSIVKEVQAFNGGEVLPEDLKDRQRYNFLSLAVIKANGQSIEADMDGTINQTNVVVPEKLSILPRFDGEESLSLKPVLLDKNGNVIDTNQEFNERYEKAESVKGVYLSRSGNYYVIKPGVQAGLQEIKALPKKISDNIRYGTEKKKEKKDVIKEFLQNPSEFLTASAFEFADLERYSDRVIEIGEYKYKNEASGANRSTSWLPEEGKAFIDNKKEKDVELTPENVVSIDEKINDALSTGQDKIEFDGKTIPLTYKFIDEVKTFRKNMDKLDSDGRFYKTPAELDKPNVNTPVDGRADGKNPTTETKKEVKNPVLIIGTNFDGQDYKGESVNEGSVYDYKRYNYKSCLNDNIVLLSHQAEGIEWLFKSLKKHKGALLADDMGLGKTLQTLCFAATCRKYLPDKFAASVLVVAPVALLDNWQEEFKKFIKPDIFKGVVKVDSSSIHEYYDDKTINLDGIKEGYLVLTTYETLRRYQMIFGIVDWGIMVLDEAQKIKNPTALVTFAAKAMKYKFGLCITGTPIENTWVDLWSILDFANPGNVLGSLRDFKNNYIGALKKCADDKTEIEKLGEKLHGQIKNIFLRRLKKELIGAGKLERLPRKRIRKDLCIMPAVQRRAYEQIISSAMNPDENLTSARALQIIAKLRDISLFPNIATIDERKLNEIPSWKIINSSGRLQGAFTELVNIQRKNEKALVFLESKKMQRILKNILEKCFSIKIPTPINGDMSGMNRQRIVDEFNAKEGFGILILSPIAAGVGLNIATANHVIHLSRPWNPAKEDQATDRAYRIGQKKDVDVYIPITYHQEFGELGSFDQKLDLLLDYKRELSEKALFPVADSSDDGVKIFQEIFGDKKKVTQTNKDYYDIEAVDEVKGVVFEKIIAELYACMGYFAEKTPDSNDNGADIVVTGCDGKDNYLVQCKTTSTGHNMGKEGIQEIYSALNYYEKKEGKKFKPVVITNAVDFTSGAKELAVDNGVQLIVREELAGLLEEYKVSKIY